MGTVDYVAPEQGIDPRGVDHRADIYSLGCTLCYLLTGRPPFERNNIFASLMAHQEHAPAALFVDRPDVSRSIDAAYLR
jgi:serine/threonine-protein kinase